MKLAPINYHAPESLTDALDILASYEDEAKVLAGGQSLIPLLCFRLTSIQHLVDLGRIAELRGFDMDDQHLRIRAGVTQRMIETSLDVGLRIPILQEAISNIAHVQIRNRGTVCGSLAHADAAAELPTVMTALDATMVIRSADGEREVAAGDFFQFHLMTVLEPHEVLVEVKVPLPSQGTYGAFGELTHRKGDFALVGAAVIADVSDDGTVDDARIVCSGLASRPLRIRAVEELLVGRQLDDHTLLLVEENGLGDVDGVGDIHASAEYRCRTAGVVIRQCLERIRVQQGVVS